MYKKTVKTVCLYWQPSASKDGLMDFWMTSKLETNCPKESCQNEARENQNNNKNGEVTKLGQGGSVCWTQIKCDVQNSFTKAECSESCECPMQAKGTADAKGFDKKMFKKKGGKTVVSKNGEGIVEGLIDTNGNTIGGLNEPKKGFPAGWEIRRWERCTSTTPKPCPGTEGVTK